MVEIQDVFLAHGAAYKQNHKLSLVQYKTFKAICDCRTSVLGGHNDVCPNCGVVKQSYNSCRNRHCPKCQTLAKEKWIDYCKPPFKTAACVVEYLGRKPNVCKSCGFHGVIRMGLAPPLTA